MIINVEFFPDTNIRDAISRSLRLARLLNCIVRFTLNGIKMDIYEPRSELDFMKDYQELAGDAIEKMEMLYDKLEEQMEV